MAKSKKMSRIDSLRAAQVAFLAVEQERKDFAEIIAMAEATGNKGVIAKCQAASKRYDEDYAYLANKRAYNLGKLIEESPAMFNKILAEVLS